MALVQGNVNVVVGVSGKGSTTAVTQASKDVEGLGAKIGTTMKASVEPLNKVKEGFERVRGNAMFLVGAAGALVGGIIALGNAFSDNARDISAWEGVQKDVAATLEHNSALLDEIAEKLGHRADKTDAEALAEKLAKQWEDNRDKIDKATGAIKAYNERLQEGIDAYGSVVGIYVGIEKERDLAVTRLNELLSVQGTILDRNLGIMRNISAEQNAFVGPPPGSGGPKPRARGSGKRAQRGDFAGQSYGGLPVSDRYAVPDEFAFAARNPAPDDTTDLGAGTGKSRFQVMAGDVRDFSASLSDSLPQMEAFTSALGKISQMWGDYAETGKGAAKATIASVGAIAMAGAEQIKNERLRAGVLSIIHLGLGTALMFVPGSQAEAAGHLAGAAILGSVAIFGGGGGGGGKKSEPTRNFDRALSDRTSSGATTVIVNGGWFGSGSPQETAAALHARMQSGSGSGFVPRAA